MTLEKIIEDDNRLAGFDELLNDDATNVTSTTSYQDFHRCPPIWGSVDRCEVVFGRLPGDSVLLGRRKKAWM
jgi:hypothetical protein